MNRKDSIAANLRANRAKAKLKQEEVAKAINKDIGTVRNYEKGETCPDLETAWVIADFFGLSLDELAGRIF